MDLNICLYCEKQLKEDNKNFCSVTCQTSEASKPYDTHQLQSYLTPNIMLSISNYAVPHSRRRSSLSQIPSIDPYAKRSSFSSSSSAFSVSTLSSSDIQNTLKQQSSWESTTSYYQQQHQQNVHTDHLF